MNIRLSGVYGWRGLAPWPRSMIGTGGATTGVGEHHLIRLLPPRDGHVTEGVPVTVRKIKAKLVLQLRNQSLSGSAISSAQGMSRHSVQAVIDAADRLGLGWGDVADMSGSASRQGSRRSSLMLSLRGSGARTRTPTGYWSGPRGARGRRSHTQHPVPQDTPMKDTHRSFQ